MVKQAILKNELTAGKRITEIELAEKFSVSRTPIREAIRMLEAEGLLIRKAIGQKFVVRRTCSDMVETFQVRIALESYAVRIVADVITEEQLQEISELCVGVDSSREIVDNQNLNERGKNFHKKLLEIAGNPSIIDHINEINEYIDFYRDKIYPSGEVIEPNKVSHSDILEALKARDGDKASELIRRHLAYALDLIKTIWE
jgi:DNA-binding GntR family transcriptional regulator